MIIIMDTYPMITKMIMVMIHNDDFENDNIMKNYSIDNIYIFDANEFNHNANAHDNYDNNDNDIDSDAVQFRMSTS